MAQAGDQVAGLQLKGVDGDYDTSWWRSRLVEGDMPAIGGSERHKELLISHATAQALRVGAGDRIEMLFVDGDRRPRRDRFKVAGIYHTGLEEMDAVMALTDLRNVRRAASWDDDAVTGYEIMLARPEQAAKTALRLDAVIDEAFYAGDEASGSCITADMPTRYPIVFDWLKAHGVNARVIVAVMMTVVLFNMAAAMLIMVLDRTGMIGVLKAAGMRNSAVRRIFLWRAAMLFVRGAVWGNIAGLGLAAVQIFFHPIGLDPSGYMLSTLPVRVEAGWWAALNAGALAVTLAAMLLPSMIVARISPEQTLKYKQ